MNCPNYGQPQPEDANFCSNCGAVLPAQTTPPASPQSQPEGSKPTPEQPPQGSPGGYTDVIYAPDNVHFDNPQDSDYNPGPSYAGFWKRLLALLIDGAILGVAGAILSSIFVRSGSNGTWFLSALLGWLYYSLMESSQSQATLGKQALGIKVTDLQGRRISFGRATGRYFAKFLSDITLGIGWLMAAFTEKKQALHDLVASTLVVNR